ncbi:unnamed protein product, partial [Symbiodinium sp. KB8]
PYGGANLQLHPERKTPLGRVVPLGSGEEREGGSGQGRALEVALQAACHGEEEASCSRK